jgi:transcription-repair coupling factor (superfamily II helicase)
LINIKAGDIVDIKDLTRKLYNIGYKVETIVNKTGEMASRGYILDIYPINENNPLRIEFWGDTIDSLRYFNVDTQLTVNSIDSITVFPNSEFIVDVEIDENERKQKYLNKYTKVTNINNYLGKPTVFFDDYTQIETSYNLLMEEILEYNLSIKAQPDFSYMNNLNDIIVHNATYFVNFDNLIRRNDGIKKYSTKTIEPFTGDIEHINNRLNAYLKQNKTVIICLTDRYKINKLLDDLDNDNLIFTNETQIFDNKINAIVKDINHGFSYDKYIVISENDLYNRKNPNYIYKTNFKYGTKIRDINKLSIGDYVVHFAHGIGRYLGITTFTKNGLMKDYLAVQYAGNDKLYIPVEKLELISKYSSNDTVAPKLNHLGGTEWQKTKLRVRKKIESIASELLALYAAREVINGYAFLPDTDEQMAFEQEFKYNETPDQLKVIAEIKKDMESKKPMDRLLCGDVGYGKTEVAFRAIFKAIMNSKQVAFLCPTTILSHQHYENALERFRSFPVNIAILNRFVTPKKANKVIADLKAGKIDLLIGTHRILSDDIIYKDLGLLIIDEEQRFGVKHKEKIKSYKNNIDILTLSATPIPRTLQMSLAGLRSFSLIETPPVNRYPVQTYVLAENNHIIKEAIYKELSRQGQVFILYNRVEDMQQKITEITRLVPEARVIFAHGQMDKLELENVMQKFIDHEYDVLLCTTIIEIGIDIPSVNTLIILDADRFGLSQLYQIRGRVGRSDKIAYCYLMYNNAKILSEIATKRLNVIREFTELGSGFSIAMRDLSIRGAGDILGSEQAGFIDSIGIELYLSMLNDEIGRLQGKTIVSEEIKVDRQPLIEVATSIDDKVADDEEIKIEIHKKINSISSYEDLINIKQELEDRFGHLPEELIIYMHEEWFEKLAFKLNINDVKQTHNFIQISLDKEMTKKIDGEKLFMEANKISRMFRFGEKNGHLFIILDTVKLDKHFIYYLIDLLKIISESLK